MRSYSDTLRDQAPMALVSGSLCDTETARARALLIRAMVGIAWSDRTVFQKVGWVLLCAVSLLCGAGAVGFFAGFVLLVFSALTGVPPERNYDSGHGSCPMCEFVIHGALYIGVLASTVFLAWALSHRERRIRRLRGLTNIQLLRAFDAWRDERACR